MQKAILNPSVKSIDKDQLTFKLKTNGPVEFVNVLDPQYYNLGSIRGSKKIPFNELDARLEELDKNKEIVTYCAGYECQASRKAAEKLSSRGFRVRAYEGGIKEWKESNLPVE